jgi:hypothetical protein
MKPLTVGFVFVLILTALLHQGNSATVAYWQFEDGTASSSVTKPFGILDSSGNGNHLDPWTDGGNGGYVYRSERAYNPIPKTGQENILSVQNTGSLPSLQTRSAAKSYGAGSYPTGIDIETITPAQFTIEAFFKPESGTHHRTVVGRDASNVATSDSRLAALYFQIRPDQSVSISFADVSGYWHEAISAAGMIQGFNWSSDPEGTTGVWYYMAAVNDGTTLSLYLANITGGTSPRLVAQKNIAESGSPNRALAKGTANGTNWHAGGWSVGRGLWNGAHTDRAYGFIDEVRISNTALSTEQFLVWPKPTVNRNPIMDAADPHVILEGNTVWMYPTSGYYRYFYAYSSTDLVTWKTHGPILNFNTIPWIPSGKHAWAPGVIKKNGTYYFYYSVGPKPSHIGVAYGSSPSGPFTDKGAALLSDNNSATFEAIDPMVFTDPQTGTSYLYAGGSAGSRLRVFELNSDMMSFAREITVVNPPNFTEGAFMHYRKGIYYLSYSHGSWNNDTYSMHYCTSGGPVGPWTYQGALMVSDGWHKGPGHHSFLYNTAMDEWYAVYHRWNNRLDAGPYSGSRSIAIEKLQYLPDGRIKPFVLSDSGVGPVRLGTTLLSDFNTDKTVNSQDIHYFSGAWLTSDAAADIAPVQRDHLVNLLDFQLLAAQWLKTPQAE